MERKLLPLLATLLFLCGNEALTAQASVYDPNEMIIKYNDPSGPQQVDMVNFLGQIGATEQGFIGGQNVYKYSVGSFPMTIYDSTFGSHTFNDIIELLNHTLGKAEVDGGSLNYEIELPPATNDPLNTNNNGLLSLSICPDYPGVFPEGEGGEKPVRIGVIDTGVDIGVVEDVFGPWVISVLSVVDSIPDSKSNDENGHGTKVVGIIADILSYMNVSAANITMIKAFENDGTTSLFNIIQALWLAQELQLDVLNLSFGYTPDPADVSSNLLVQELQNLSNNNVLVVVSAGNNNINLDQEDYFPASIRNIEHLLTIGSVDCNGVKSTFSNYGAHIVDFGGPGEQIAGLTFNYSLVESFGTSFSAPFVTGLAAVYGSQLDAFDPNEIKCMLGSSALVDDDLSFFFQDGRMINYELNASSGCNNSNPLQAPVNNNVVVETEGVGISPNPFTENLSLSIGIQQENTIVELSIYDLSGHRLWQQKALYDKGQHTIVVPNNRVTNWPIGVYIAKVKMGNQILPYKLVKR